MKCPHCDAEIGFQKVCPSCGKEISYGGNTTFYSSAQKGTLTFKDIFSDVFKKHTAKDALNSLARTPNTAIDMLQTWRKPWMFLPVFLFMLVITAFMWWFTLDLGYNTYFYLFNSIGCMLLPLPFVILMWELDIHANVNIFDVFVLLLLGGLLSTSSAFFINSYTMEAILPNSGAWTAALSEEPLKLLVCVLFILVKKRKYYALDGLVIGACIAAGFQFIEAIFYMTKYYTMSDLTLAEMLLKAGMDPEIVKELTAATYEALRTDLAMSQMMNRNISVFGGHITYTAPFVAALCHSMNGARLSASDFTKPRFIGLLLLGMACHALNNSGLIPNISIFEIESIYLNVSLIDLINTAVGVSAMLYMIRLGVKQALEVSDIRQAIAQVNGGAAALKLRAVSGQFAGGSFSITACQPLVIGRQPDKCSVVLSANGVSRMHCVIELSAGGLSVRDLGSANGTRINGMAIAANQSIALRPGDVIQIGTGDERFEVA